MGQLSEGWALTGGGGGLCAVEQRWIDGLRAQLQPDAGMHMDVDQHLVVAIMEGETVPMVVAPL